MEPNQRNRNEKEGRVKGNNTVEPNERNRQEREGRVKVNYYCGTKPFKRQEREGRVKVKESLEQKHDYLLVNKFETTL